MEDAVYTPIQVARRANAHPNSIRNWAREYAEFLSPPGNAGRRLFTDEDMQVLCAVAALRKSGMPPGEVAERLRNPQPPIVDAYSASVAIEENAQEAPQAPQTAQDAPLAIQIGYTALQGQIDALARRVETQQRGAMLWTLGMGIWIGIVLSGLILFVLWTLAR